MRSLTLVWVLPADALSSLEGVERVWEVDIRVGLIDQLVQTVNTLHHSHTRMSAARPFCMLEQRSEIVKNVKNDYIMCSFVCLLFFL